MSSPLDPPVTLASAATAVAGLLSRAEIERPRAEAEALVTAASGHDRTSLVLHPDAPLSADQARRLLAMTERRAAREPLPYILGQVEFYSLPLSVSPAAIVPRPDTEILVEAVIERCRARPARLALDVGTGCGAIAATLATHLPQITVAATDISLEALLLARENCRRHGVAHRVSLIRTDLLAGLAARADCIAANLPYVRSGDFPSLQPEVRDFEPRGALDGGPDGLCPIRRLSVHLFDHLCEDGFAALEVGAGQAPEVANLLRAGQLSEVEIIADYAGIERVVIGWRRG